MRKTGVILLSLIMLTTLLSTLATAAPSPGLTDSPVIVLEALNSDGSPAENVTVTIRALTGNGGVVFQGETNRQGQVNFISRVPADILKAAPGDVADMVYEAYFTTPDGQVRTSVFSVPHLKQSEAISVEDRRRLEPELTQKVQVQFQNNAVVKSESTDIVPDAATTQEWCEWMGNNVYLCLVDQRFYNEDTLITDVHSDLGENIDITLTSSARVKIDVGYKNKFMNTWGVDGRVTLSADVKSTSVDYPLTNNMGRYGRHVYATYKYLYERREWRYHNQGTYQVFDEEHKVIPISLVGPSTLTIWFTDSRNGKPVSDVRDGLYGDRFPIFKEGHATISYSSEQGFSVAAIIPTPVGSFSPSLTTAFGTAQKIKWHTTTDNIYWHYDLDRSGKMWYVTR